MTQVLHFSLGPVQGFIAQARRTRDLWAGSFLLSWLVGKAILAGEDEAAKKGGGFTTTFPIVAGDPIYQALRKAAAGETPSETPYLGSLSNHVRAEVPDGFDPRVMTRAIQAAWVSLAEAVWDDFVKTAALDDHQKAMTRSIWDTQIGVPGSDPPPFWECQWVMGPSVGPENDLRWLDTRKRLRPFSPRDQGGEQCMMMAGFEELSGLARSPRDARDAFWNAIRQAVAKQRYDNPKADTLDLREGERLSAIAFVKRMFPLLDRDTTLRRVIGWPPGKVADAEVGRRRDIKYWPSTPYMASIHWVARAHHLAQEKAEDFGAFVRRKDPVNGRAEEKTTDEVPVLQGIGVFREIDGKFFDPDELKSRVVNNVEKNQILSTKARLRSTETATTLLGTLRAELHELCNDDKHPSGIKVGEPAPYYAVLAMDGDRAGAMLRHNVKEVSERLKLFAERVARTVTCHNGFVIYAGGDDLKALLPLEDALPCAIALEKAWHDTFAAATDPDIKAASISAAIVYAHKRVVLRWVMEEVQSLLDDIAKEANGRASLAIRVMRQGAEHIHWVSAWRLPDGRSPPRVLDALIKREGSATKRVLGTNRFLYRLADRLHFLFPPGDVAKQIHILRAGGGGAPIGDDDQLRELLLAVTTDDETHISPEVMNDFILVSRLHPNESSLEVHERPLRLDAAMLIRHMADNWRKLPTTATTTTIAGTLEAAE